MEYGEIDKLRAQAAKCRWLARSLLDDIARAKLLELANGYEAQAVALEMGESDNGPQ